MSGLVAAAGAAFSFGIFTSISPCLLATNVTAISFLARRVENLRYVIVSCACYIVGQALAYVLLAMLLVTSMLSQPTVSHWLQKYMFRLLGPILVICALFLLELITIQFGSGRLKEWANKHARASGFWIAAVLGIIFAMSFCPTTAAWFFLNLIPLAIANKSGIFLPTMYAAGVALPVMVFSLLIATAAHRVARVFALVGRVEYWARNIAGGVFLVVGIYFTLAFTLELF